MSGDLCLDAGKASAVRLIEQAHRSLDFLQAIEKTIDCLAANTKIIEFLNDEIHAFIDELPADKPLDPAGQASALLGKAAGSAMRIYEDAIGRRQNARMDHRLTDEDGVEEAYSGLIAAAADLHNMLEGLRAAVETSDALKEPPIGGYGNAKELFDALDS